MEIIINNMFDLNFAVTCGVSFCIGYITNKIVNRYSISFDSMTRSLYLSSNPPLYLNKNRISRGSTVTLDNQRYPSKGVFVYGLPQTAPCDMSIVIEGIGGLRMLNIDKGKPIEYDLERQIKESY